MEPFLPFLFSPIFPMSLLPNSQAPYFLACLLPSYVPNLGIPSRIISKSILL